ncbi:thioredoxin family protein [Niabella insulamsoli]|uniref:thioredoxin family protein n=1 Tax=Niabella insulamsoli TaxID=3144874 RepID=UPI0031FC95B4
MKFFFLLLLTTCSICSTAQQFETTKDRTGRKMLKGFVTDSVLRADSAAFKWYVDNEKVYVPADSIINKFSAQDSSVSFMVFFGTWCPDSHYVIPRFYKITHQANIDPRRITLFALDRTKNDAAHFAANFNVQHVPTIIILKNGKEMGRVVEYGKSGRFDEELAAVFN